MSGAYLALKEHDKAITAARKAVDMSGRNDPVIIAVLARTYALIGNRPKAEELLQELMRSTSPPPVDVAEAFAALGQTDLPFEWLERAYRDRQPTLIWLNSKVTPLMRLQSASDSLHYREECT